MDFSFDDEYQEMYKGHPEHSVHDRFCCSIEYLQDQLFRTAKLSGCTPPLSEVDLEDWTDLYHNEIKNLDVDAIIKKYNVKFYRPVNGLMEITVRY